MNFANWRNPYHGFTVVRILYCSGDLYAGDTEMPWGPGGTMVQRRGYRNTQATLDWTLRQFLRLQKFAVVGYSAGALGLQVWAGSILRQFEDRHASAVVYADSCAGMLYPLAPPCHSFRASSARCGRCASRPLSLRRRRPRAEPASSLGRGNVAETMQKHPNVWFASVSIKADWVQRAFNTFFSAGLNAETFYREATLQYKEYARNDNFRVYLLNGDEHWQLAVPTLHTATPLGGGADALGVGPRLRASHGALWQAPRPCLRWRQGECHLHAQAAAQRHHVVRRRFPLSLARCGRVPEHTPSLGNNSVDSSDRTARDFSQRMCGNHRHRDAGLAFTHAWQDVSARCHSHGNVAGGRQEQR